MSIELYLQGLRPHLNAIEEKMGFGAGTFSNGWNAVESKIGHLTYQEAEKLEVIANERSIPLPSGQRTSLLEAPTQLASEGLELDESTLEVIKGLEATFKEMFEVGFTYRDGFVPFDERISSIINRQFNPIKEFWLDELIKKQGSLDMELNQKLNEVYADATEGRTREQLLDYLSERVYSKLQERLQRVPMKSKDWLTVRGYKQGFFDNNLLRYALKGDVEVLTE